MTSSNYQKWEEDQDHLGKSQQAWSSQGTGWWRKLFPRDLPSKSIFLMLAVILLLWILLIVVLVKGSRTSQELSQLKRELRTNASIWTKDVEQLSKDMAVVRRNDSALWTDLRNWENKVSESHARLLEVQSKHNELSTQMTQALAEAGKDRQDIRSEMFRALAAVRVRNSSCSQCSDSWLAFEGSCYFFSTDKAHWNKAQQNCSLEQAHLVIVNNLEEQERDEEVGKDCPLLLYQRGNLAEPDRHQSFEGWTDNSYSLLKTFLTQNTRGLGYWIGLAATRTRRKVTGYQWVDGTKLTFSYWNEGEPNDSRSNENCVLMLYMGRWNDAPCNNLNDNWICEKRQRC